MIRLMGGSISSINETINVLTEIFRQGNLKIMMLPELFYNAKATLGEGPAWDVKPQTLYWGGVLEKRVYAGSKLFIQLDDYVGCLAPRNDGGLIINQRFGFWNFEPDTNR